MKRIEDIEETIGGVSYEFLHAEPFNPVDFRRVQAFFAQLSFSKKRTRLLKDDVVTALDKNTMIVARVNGVIIGMALVLNLYRLEGKFGEVEKVFVDKKFRGRGIGRQIMERMEAFAARNAGYKRLKLLVQPDNRPARKLYEDLGWKKISTLSYRKKIRRKSVS